MRIENGKSSILKRLSVLLLIPSLIVDPALGTTFATTSLGAALRVSSFQTTLFTTQALELPTVAMSAPPIMLSEVPESSKVRRWAAHHWEWDAYRLTIRIPKLIQGVMEPVYPGLGRIPQEKKNAWELTLRIPWLMKNDEESSKAGDSSGRLADSIRDALSGIDAGDAV